MIKSTLGTIIFIVIISMFILVPDQSVALTHSYLGKSLVLAIILFYTWIDVYLGTFVALLVIWFYLLRDTGPLRLSDGGIHSPKEIFMAEHCSADGQLKHKGMTVRGEMVEHVFPEVVFSGEQCNLCDVKCQYTVLH
jgi:hypothetical protein